MISLGRMSIKDCVCLTESYFGLLLFQDFLDVNFPYAADAEWLKKAHE